MDSERERRVDRMANRGVFMGSYIKRTWENCRRMPEEVLLPQTFAPAEDLDTG
jgi:hypothetical protein